MSGDIKKVEISSADNCCDACMKFKGRRFNIDKAPELPNPDCTNIEYGCRCNYLPVTIFNL